MIQSSANMLVALDVHYDDHHRRGTGAAVLFERWADATPHAHLTTIFERIQPYVPGEFFRRELPILLALIGQIQDPLGTILVDSYVRLGDKSGLGQHLFEKLDRKIPVIGIAKSRFYDANAAEVLRGRSRSPLYVTAAGIPLDEAADHIPANARPLSHCHPPEAGRSAFKRSSLIGKHSRWPSRAAEVN